jgi:GTP cyclohydrolase I
MTGQLADAIHEVLNPNGTAVVIEAEHLCMSMRGVKKDRSRIVTTATRGRFDRGGVTRAELLDSLNRRGS